MFSYGYPRHASPFGGFFGGRPRRASYADEEAYAYEQYRKRQAYEAQLRRQRQEEEVRRRQAYLQEVARRQAEQEAYEQAVRAEQARRLAARHQQRSADPEDPLVRVVLPDGRRATVPLSWVNKVRAKHGSPAARDTRSPSPPVDHDEALASNSATEEQDDLTVDSGSESESEGEVRSRMTLEEAALTLQRYVRRYLHHKQLSSIRHAFLSLRADFASSPAVSDPSNLVFTSPTEPRLAYNTPANRPLQAYEESLTKLLMRLDGVESGGDEEVKRRRKALVVEVEKALERLDELKRKGWEAQQAKVTATSEEKEDVVMDSAADATDVEVEPTPEATFVDAPETTPTPAPAVDFTDTPAHATPDANIAEAEPQADAEVAVEPAEEVKELEKAPEEDGSWDMVEAEDQVDESR